MLAPEQDERIKKEWKPAFEKKLTELLQGSKPNHENLALMKIMYGSGYTDGCTSRNSEIEALKAEIESLRCCGNCGRSEHQRPTDIELCHHCVRNMNYHRTPALDNWTPKSKLWKNSTTTISESPCNH